MTAPLEQAQPVTAQKMVTVRDVDGPPEMAACDELYGEVMGLRAEDGRLNPRLLLALQRNGGYVLGAFAGRELVGFAYSFPAWTPSPQGPATFYQYSQLAVVARRAQDQGIGRRLKLAQRERALADGVHTIRWAFDPMKTRNAHFNLDVLGGRLVDFVPSMYGARGFGHDHDDESDRFVVDWRLDETRVPDRSWAGAAAGLPIGEVRRVGSDLLVAVPARWESLRAEEPRSAADLRHRLRDVFTDALTEGLVGVSCHRTTPGIACYRFIPKGCA